jgi:hypothetical protein
MEHHVMSRKLLAFLLSELETVRIVCKACSAVTEMATEKASGKFETPQCPLCRELFFRPRPGTGTYNPLFNLLVAIEEVKRFTTVDVEFVLPDQSPSEAKR